MSVAFWRWTCRWTGHAGMPVKSQAPVSSSLLETGAKGSDLSVFGEDKRVLHVDPEIAHGILDLAVAEKDLDSP